MAVPDVRRKLDELARNLWWAWNPEVIDLFNEMDDTLWRECDHNPIRFFKRISEERWQQIVNDEVVIMRVERAHGQMQRYMDSSTSWNDRTAAPLGRRPVAYFCAEFGLHESLPIYSGGLGILAGDHLKSASDLAVPLVGVGILYREGYFHQTIDREGRQQAHYVESAPEELPLTLLKDADGKPLTVEVPLRDGRIMVQIWQANVGRVRLFLLDAAAVGNAHPELRDLTSRLYGGDARMRLLQEMLLGIGGMRALLKLGIEPGAIHLNEGHSAFAVLELARHWAAQDKVSLWEAFAEAAARSVFTTHTPVPAGHDRFDPDMFDETMQAYRDELGIDREALLSLGRVNTANRREMFCMTVLALKGARKSNGVSALHGRVSRRMWKVLYPNAHHEHLIPIGHITNGIHLPSWIAPEMHDLFTRHFGRDWTERLCDPDMWAQIENVDDQELWDVQRILKGRLVRFVRRKLTAQRRRWGASQDEIDRLQNVMDPEGLTIGFARRFATYKRAGLIMRDMDRLLDLVRSDHRPVQFVFAGKAHPADAPGQELIRQIAVLTHDPDICGRMVFLEDYDINVGRHLVQGVDVWLNNPRRPMEASGTSGMKVTPNGGLNLSVLDGWWPEGYDGKNGFAVESTSLGANLDEIDRRDSEQLLRVLQDEVVPLFYDRGGDNIPHGWMRRVKRAIRTLIWRFNTDRMVADYTRMCYLPCADALNADMQMT